LGAYALSWGFVFGTVLQLGWLAWGLRRAGLSVLPRPRGGHPAIRRVIGQYIPMIAASSLMSGSALIDQTMATTLGPGGVSALNYGNKLIALFMGIGATALGTAVLPYFSRLVAAGDWRGVRRVLSNYTALILGATLPLTLLLVACSEPLVRLLFHRGAFSADDVRVVGWVQALYAIQIPFHTLGILYVRLISSLKSNRILFYGTILNFSINISMNWILMTHLGVAGISLSTSIVYMVSLAYLAISLHRLLRGQE
jgi:putative peptidoglycan lipid II flippase